MRTTGLTTNNVFLTLPLAGGAFGFVGTGSSWIGFTGTGFSGSLNKTDDLGTRFLCMPIVPMCTAALPPSMGQGQFLLPSLEWKGKMSHQMWEGECGPKHSGWAGGMVDA